MLDAMRWVGYEVKVVSIYIEFTKIPWTKNELLNSDWEIKSEMEKNNESEDNKDK